MRDDGDGDEWSKIRVEGCEAVSCERRPGAADFLINEACHMPRWFRQENNLLVINMDALGVEAASSPSYTSHNGNSLIKLRRIRE